MIHISKLLRKLIRRKELDPFTTVICGQNDSEDSIAMCDRLNQSLLLKIAGLEYPFMNCGVGDEGLLMKIETLVITPHCSPVQ